MSWHKKMFVPHEANNHYPHFWRKNSVALFLALILLIEIAIFAQSFLNFKRTNYLAEVLPLVLEALTNDQRAQNNAPSLKENPLLVAAANAKAKDMATRGYFAHNTPEGYLPWYWLQKAGYQYDHAGENLAVNFTDSKDVVDAWMKSPTHRENIVKPIYTETGIGMAVGVYEGRPAIYVAQFFGTPKEVKVAVSKPTVEVQVKTPVKVAFSTTSSTTTVVAGAETDIKSPTPSTFKQIEASPRQSGGVVLTILLGFVLAALLLIIFINGKFHHPKIVFTAACLMLVILGSMVLNERVLRDRVEVADVSSTQASV